jgi:hypothetical protein
MAQRARFESERLFSFIVIRSNSFKFKLFGNVDWGFALEPLTPGELHRVPEC